MFEPRPVTATVTASARPSAMAVSRAPGGQQGSVGVGLEDHTDELIAIDDR